VEQINFFDRQLVREIAKSDPLSLSPSMVINQARETHKQHIPEQTDHYPLMAKAVDVFGKEVDVITSCLCTVLALPNVGVNIPKMPPLEHSSANQLGECY
jgi:hypothetical protein